MAFGFDASLILPASSTPQTSLSELVNAANSGQQRQVEQAKMQEMLYQQGRQHSLADLVRQGVPLADAYQQTGYGDEAQAAQEHALKFKQLHMDLMRSKANEVKTADQAEKYITSLAPEFQAEHMFDAQAKGQDALAQVQGFADAGLTPDKRAAVEETRRRQAAEADPTSVTSQIRASVAKQLGLPVETGTAGNAIDDRELDLGEKAQAAKERAATARIMMGLGANAGPVDLSAVPQWIKTAAATYNTEGTLPTFKDPGGYLHKQIMQVASAMAPEANIPLNKAAYAANKANLQEAVTQGGQQDVKEGKALGDIQILKGTMGKLWSSDIQGVNFLERSIQDWQRDPNYAAYQTSLAATLPSINAVLNSGQMSVGARDDVKELLKEKDNPAAMRKALDIITQDMARSTQATHKRISNARAAIAGKPGSFSLDDSEPPPGQTGSAAAPHPQDTVAMKWARAHLKDKDPKAAEMAAAILHVNGAQ